MDRRIEPQPITAEEDIIEAKAFIDLFKVAPQTLVDQAHFDCVPLGEGCAISLPSAPAMGLNRILGLRSIDELNTAYDWMSKKHGRRYLQLNAEAASAKTREWIEIRGLSAHGSGWAKLRREAPLAPMSCNGDVLPRKVRSDEAESFGAMMCAGFGFPESLTPLWSAIVGKNGWTCFFGELNGEPIATAAMYASDGWAWLGGGTTAPQFRNRGAQKALITARLNEGAAQEVKTFVVETAQPSAGGTNISHANLLATGFKQVYTRMNYLLPERL